ncbi:MAG: hypothetical protein JO303_03080 [Caulobacteraceae bacterium]|nr:hypothetical protein [Caulobacteraceae bacterium]
MPHPDDAMREEIEALWSEVFGEAPPIRCDPKLLTAILVRSLSPPPPYGDPPAQRDREPLRPHRPGDVTNSPQRPN